MASGESREPAAAPDSGYGESSQYAAHLDRGWALLDRGDLTAARTSVSHAQEVRPDDPDASMLQGAIALAEGDADESLRCYDRALELDPEYLEPYAAAAQVCLFDLDDPGRALRYCAEASELEGLSAFEVLDLQLMAAECELARGDADACRTRLAGLAEVGVLVASMELAASNQDPSVAAAHPDPDRAAASAFLYRDLDGEPLEDEERVERASRILQFATRLARVRIDVGDTADGLSLLTRLVELFPREPDAWYLRSEAEYRHGSLRQAAESALKALELDSAYDLPRFVPSPAVIHRRAVQVIKQSGDAGLRDLTEDDVALSVFVHDQPPPELVMEGVDPRIMTLALASKPAGSTEDEPPVLTGIAVYRRNLARFARDADQFDEELRLAILDELAVFFGYDDARRGGLGLPPLPAAPEPPPEEEEPEKPRRRSRRRTRAN